VQKSQEATLALLGAVSSGLEIHADVPEFFGRVSQTVAELVGAKRAAFWRLGSAGLLTVQPKPYGFEAGSPIDRSDFPLGTDGDGFVEGVTPGGENSIAVPWRAATVPWSLPHSDRVIGTLVAYDSERGFTRDDAWVLRVASAATGLIWRYKEAEEELGTTHERLQEAALARRSLLSNVASGGDEARRRFATYLHDDSLQLLTAAELQLERIRADADSSPQAARFDELMSTLRSVEDSLRELLVKVNPVPLDSPLGLAETIHERLELLRTHTGIEPDVDVQLPEVVPAATGAIVLKTLAEAITNIEKHAHATRIRVTCKARDAGIRVEVVDDGTGFVLAERLDQPGHIGLVAVTERIQLNGGWFRIESDPGAGTRLEFWVPTPA
jgi:signal transduction histidine kinase